MIQRGRKEFEWGIAFVATALANFQLGELSHSSKTGSNYRLPQKA